MIHKYLVYLSVLVLFWSCTDPVDAKTENEILSFSVEGQIAEAAINSDQATVFVEVEAQTDLTKVTPEIGLSENAKITPASGVETNFSNGKVNYTVTSESNEVKNWNVSVEKEKSSEAKMLTFYLSRQESEAIITDNSVSIEVKLGTNLSNLKPEITVSPKATISPASGDEVDFSNGLVIYTVTAENGTELLYKVSVNTPKIYEANILTFIIPNQIEETVFDGSTLLIEVPVGYDLTHVTPEITISEGTTVSPQSGEVVNFAETGYVDYSVTTEIDTKKHYRVYVTEEVIKADNPNIQYMGRVDFTNPLKPRLYAPGTTIKVKFKGTYCQILIDDQELWGNSHNYLEIVVDGTEATRIQTTTKKNTIDIVKNLTDGEHTLTITKNTEAGIGYIDFVGFRCDELLVPDALPERRIEFIGNSITCGYGVDASEVACGTGEWYDQHSAYYAYGPTVARMLNAQWMLSSESGIGVVHSCCDKTNVMADIYETVNLGVSGNDWDFTNYQADVVTICLGQNDGIQDSVTFCSAYVEFIGTVRSKYANANIVCLTSPMADDNLFNSQKNYLTGIVNNVNDNKVSKLFLTPNLNRGCDYHPNMQEHELTANELEAFIRDLMNW
ncbi:MAG: DUF5018 domain-containing protein [Salinivirgaceae bacterium]|jgi:hypothetical protein|nr:DUF5018 domain-containing protein [Salinivirgaceae bacterium]